jgi:hypothetical protein
MDPIEFPIRSTFFDWPDLHIGHTQERKVHPRSPEKKFGSHT